MMQPSFHRRVIDRFSGLIHEVNEKFAERWAACAARGEPVNLTDDASELTLEIVLRSIFGADLERLGRQMGANPFEVVAKEQNRDLKFAFRFRSLATGSKSSCPSLRTPGRSFGSGAPCSATPAPTRRP